MFTIKSIFLCLLVTKCVLAAPSTLLTDVENIEIDTATNLEHTEVPELLPTTSRATDGEVEVSEYGIQFPEYPAVETYLQSSEESHESSAESQELTDRPHLRTARHLGLGVGVIGISGGFGGYGGYGGYRPYYQRSYGGGYGYGYGYGRPWGYGHHYRGPYGF